jgi:hypothetical protein|tara:strand:- start:332 stop:490 length:159 start_codon:yes stop_codon:yes gene_type:complete
MPKNTRVGRCVQKLKPKHGKGAYAICQKSTKQSYKTGKSLNAARKRGRKKPK